MIEKGKKVKIKYSVSVNGEVIESSDGSEPLEYLHGSGELITGLEKVLEGRRQGETLECVIAPEDAYGPVLPEAIIEVGKEFLPKGDIRVGVMLYGRGEKGESLRGCVKEVLEESVIVDFNHPLAGKELHFAVEIVAIEGDQA